MRPIPPTVAQNSSGQRSGPIVDDRRRRRAAACSARTCVAERAVDVVVLAVDVAGDRAADGDEAGARRDRHEPARGARSLRSSVVDADARRRSSPCAGRVDRRSPPAPARRRGARPGHRRSGRVAVDAAEPPRDARLAAGGSRTPLGQPGRRSASSGRRAGGRPPPAGVSVRRARSISGRAHRSIRPLRHVAARSGAAPCRHRASAATLSATFAGEPPQLRAAGAPALRSRPPSRRRRGRRGSRQRRERADVTEAAPERELAQDRQRDADRRERVVDQQRAAVARPARPSSRMSARAGA